MTVSVSVETVYPRVVAAVRREVAPGAVGSVWRPALDAVWAFIRSQTALWTDGHNVFLYQHATRPGGLLLCAFGVEVTRRFDAAGEVHAIETPGGEAAVAVHRGPYNRMHEAHDAIRKWMAANRRESAGRTHDAQPCQARRRGRFGRRPGLNGQQRPELGVMSDEHLACDAQAARLAEHHQPWAVWMVDVNHQRQLSQSRLRFAPWTPGELLLRKRVRTKEYRGGIAPRLGPVLPLRVTRSA